MINGTQNLGKSQQFGNLGGHYQKTTNTISQNYVSEERDQPQRSKSQDNKPQNYPQFPQNQYNEQLKNVQMSQRSDKSVAVPGGVDYTLKGQTIQNGQSKFSASYAQNGTSQPPQTLPKPTQQSLGTHTYQLNQYDQTDTINFPATPQNMGYSQQRQAYQSGQQKSYQSGPQQASNLAYQQQSYQSGPQQASNLAYQQAYQQRADQERDQYYQSGPQQAYQSGPQQAYQSGPQQASNLAYQQRANQGQQQPYSGGHLSRQARFNQENEGWESQTLDRRYQRSGSRGTPRRTRSQPRCCSRSGSLPGKRLEYTGCPIYLCFPVMAKNFFNFKSNSRYNLLLFKAHKSIIVHPILEPIENCLQVPEFVIYNIIPR
jgi:hypothetical protein